MLILFLLFSYMHLGFLVAGSWELVSYFLTANLIRISIRLAAPSRPGPANLIEIRIN